MQLQPRPHRSRAEARRARQAAQISDDTFKGGGPLSRRGGLMPRSPWNFGAGHLWDGRSRPGAAPVDDHP